VRESYTTETYERDCSEIVLKNISTRILRSSNGSLKGDRLLMTTYRETGMGEAKNWADQNFFAVELSPLVFLYDLR